MASFERRKSSLTNSSPRQLGDGLEKEKTVRWNDQEINDEHPSGRCAKCGKWLEGNFSLVKQERFHPCCFKCEHCHKPLGTEYFIIGGKNYCLEDKDRYLDKCVKCHKAIQNKAIRTENSTNVYHPECFTCTKCGVVLHGKFFYAEDGGAICEDDFTASREICRKCAKPILESSLRALNSIYHPKCFTCSLCPKLLEGQELFYRSDTNEPICKDDYARYVAKTCDGCKTKIVEERFIKTSNDKFFHTCCFDSPPTTR